MSSGQSPEARWAHGAFHTIRPEGNQVYVVLLPNGSHLLRTKGRIEINIVANGAKTIYIQIGDRLLCTRVVEIQCPNHRATQTQTIGKILLESKSLLVIVGNPEKKLEICILIIIDHEISRTIGYCPK